MTTFADLGLKPVINAAGTLTRWGGALMRPEVLAAMEEAARHFIDLPAAQERVGARIATLLGVPAAHVCAGASAGLMAATAACLAGTDPARIAALPTVTGPRHQVIVQRAQRNDYDQAVRAAGATFVEIGAARRTHPWELEAAITPATAAIVLFEAFADTASLPLSTVTAIARPHGIPVIVDAAAELPPLANLRRFIDAGADLAVFSGGKDIRGPQTTGLIVGRPDLIRAVAANSSPNAAVGRSLKVGKEELAGFLRALELYLAEDQDARLSDWERRVAAMVAALSALPGLRAFAATGTNGVQPAHIPRVHVELDDGPAIAAALFAHDPPVAVTEWDRGIVINPQTLAPHEDALVLAALRSVLAAR